MKPYEIINVSNLEKIIPSRKPKLIENEGICLRNEKYSYQVAIKNNSEELFFAFPKIEVRGGLKEFVRIRTVENVICQTTIRNNSDDYYLTKKASVMPDILKDDEPLRLRIKEWNAIFVTVEGDLMPGTYDIELSFSHGDGTPIGSSVYKLTVLDECLGDFDCDYTNWFHYDSLSSYYDLEPFSDEYNEIMWKFVKNAVAHRMNTLLVPHITPALDTYVGGKRITTQLSLIRYENGKYYFDFDRLISFMRKARETGIERFEMAHLFTQWGATSAPKVVATINSEEKKIFGWETKSSSKEYLDFLKQYLLALTGRLKEEGFDKDEVFFHISDEPNGAHLENYLFLKKEIKPYLNEYRICDALSDYRFFEMGAVDAPIVSTIHAKEFMDHDVKDLRVYHCCSESYDYLSNRFISMPSLRTRIIGIQLYMTNSKGFLQWGYNFYNSAFTKRYIDPYMVNDADGSFQSGDAFIVYPAKDGHPYDSIRHESLLDGFQDYMLLRRLEEKIGREEVLKLLDSYGFKADFTNYPRDDRKFLEFRKKAHQLL